MSRFINKVFHGDARTLLRALPTASLDAVITDGMYGTSKTCLYDWGPDPARGDPVKHWQYHEPIYQECRRVLKPGGVLAWAQDIRFNAHFSTWFGPHRIWTMARFLQKGGRRVTAHAWVVQTQDQRPIRFPDRDGLVLTQALGELRILHPCIKSVEEMTWLMEALTQPGQVVLDCFCGLGSTLVAAQQLGRRWIGCDKSRTYCQVAMKRLAELDVYPKPYLASRPRSLSGGNGQSEPFAAARMKDGTATPRWLFDMLNERVIELTGQGFELDAAAEEWNAKCAHYFDEETDALKQDWSAWATVFCNPPFSARLISKFVAKALEAADKGSTVVLLLPSWPGYPWFQELKRRGQMQDIIGPVAFERADGSKVVLNNGYKTTALVVATLAPGVNPGTNGEPIRKATVQATAAH